LLSYLLTIESTPEPQDTPDNNNQSALHIGNYIIENFNIYSKSFWDSINVFNKTYHWAILASQEQDIENYQLNSNNTTLKNTLTGAYILSSLYSVKPFLGAIEGDKSFSLVTTIPMASAAMYAAKNHLFDANSIGSTVLEYISSPLTHLGFNMLLNASFLPTYKMAAIPFGISILKSATSAYMPTVSHGLEILQGGFNTYNIWGNTSPQARIIKATEMLKTAYSAVDIASPLSNPTLPQGNEKLKLILSERIEHFTKNLSNISKENVLEDSLLSLNKTYTQAKNISIGNKKFASEEINLYTSIRKVCEDKVEFSKVDSCIDGQYDKLIHTFAETNKIFHESEA
jgi:hypothetical protein